MAKEKDNTEPKKSDSALVRVRVLRAIVIDGLRIAPRQTGERKFEPVEAVIPRAFLAPYGPEYVVEIGPAADDAKIGPI